MTPPRCILLVGQWRCHRRVSKRGTDRFLCRRHATPWMLTIVDDQCGYATRRMLAFSRWETAAEGQRLIAARFRKAEAA